MRNELATPRTKTLGLGLLSALIIVLVATAQIALAGPKGDSHEPPPPPELPAGALDTSGTDVPPTPLPPGVTPAPEAMSAPYTWFESAMVGSNDDVAVFVPARSMSVGGQPASGHIIVQSLGADEAAPVGADAVPDRPTLQFSGRSAQISVYGHTASTEAGDITKSARFSTPLQITLGITDEVWEAAGGDITNFEVRYYGDQGRWVGVPGEVDPFSPRSVTVGVGHLTTFGLFYEEPDPIAPPDGGDISLGMTSAGIAALFGLALVAAGFYVRRRATARL